VYELSSLIQYFLNNSSLRPVTLGNYKRSLYKFSEFVKEHALGVVDDSSAHDYVKYLASTNLTHSTRRTHIIVLKSLFTFLEKKNLHANVARDVHVPARCTEYKRAPLSREQARELLAACKGDDIISRRDYAIVTILLRCGLRAIEVMRANIGDIRPMNDRFVLWVQSKGRDDKDEYVVLTPESLSALQGYLELRKPYQSTDPMFISHAYKHKGPVRLSTDSIQKVVKKGLARININNPFITCHSLRHTFATLAYINNASIFSVQKAMRHSNINSTIMYMHMVNRLRDGAENFIDL
jgi:integrase/recombinase XerD